MVDILFWKINNLFLCLNQSYIVRKYKTKEHT